jgi:hypothetical protein
LELWILPGLVVIALAIGAVARLRRSRRAADEQETRNIYPLW